MLNIIILTFSHSNVSICFHDLSDSCLNSYIAYYIHNQRIALFALVFPQFHIFNFRLLIPIYLISDFLAPLYTKGKSHILPHLVAIGNKNVTFGLEIQAGGPIDITYDNKPIAKNNLR